MRAGAALLALVVVLAGCAAPFTAERQATDAPPVSATPTGADASAPTTASVTPPASTPHPDAVDGSPTPTATSTPRPASPTPRPAGKVAVAGLPLSFDEEAVYRDVVAMHGRSYASAPSVRLRVKERPAPSRTDQVWDTTAFMRLWGFDPAGLNTTGLAGLTVGERVYLYAGPVPTPAGRRSVLAHEFVHVLQHDADAFARTSAGVRSGAGNARRVYLAVVEGSATYVQSRYVARHLNATPADRTWAGYSADRSRFGAYVVAPYYFGTRYVRQRVDAVANVSSVYDRPPTTTEQVLHGLAPDEEPARPLSVGTDVDGTDWFVDDRRVRGELFVRLVLEGELDRERAARAAAGWGADRVVAFGEAGTGASAHAWVLRWDAPGEAEEFAAATRAYLDARGHREGGRWTDGETTFDLRHAGDETVVVLVGPDRFVENASVDGAGGDVTVTVGG